MFELKEFQYCLTDLYYYVPHEKIIDKELIQNIFLLVRILNLEKIDWEIQLR